MTGGAIIAILTAYGWITGKTVSRRNAVLAIIGFLFVAFFMSWRDEHLAVITAQAQMDRSKPKLVGSIDMLSSSPAPNPENALIVLTAHVKNLGAPSIAEFADCTIKTASGKIIDGEFGPIPYGLSIHFTEPKLPHQKGEPAMIYTRDDNLLVKATGSPIQSGGAVSGWLYFIVRGIKANEILNPGTIVSISVGDVSGQKIILTHTITASNTSKGLPDDTPF